jgi:hypothetical protein
MESILQSIKKLLGVQSDYTVFDDDIIIHINTVFATLNQLNIGPSTGFFITDSTSVWSDYIDESNLQMIKTYIYLKVKLIFDPPATSVVVESYNRTISEIEWRLYVEGDKNNIIIAPPIEEI